MSVSASDVLKRSKRALRARVRALRDAIPPGDRARWSLDLARSVLALPEVAAASTVMGFA